MKQMREDIVWKELNICTPNKETNDHIKMINPFEQFGQEVRYNLKQNGDV
jgi:hypothetical protein